MAIFATRLVRQNDLQGDDQQLQTGYVVFGRSDSWRSSAAWSEKAGGTVLAGMSKEFDGLYAKVGRPSIPPERLLRALLLQVFYSVRSERLLMEQLNHNLLFRWFVGLEIDDGVWDHAVFSKKRDRLLNQDLAPQFFARVKEQAVGLMSDEHFTVDGTLIEVWARQKSFRRKDEDDGSGSGGDFHGEPRSNHTHASSTDPEARLYKKSASQEAKLGYLGHMLVENRNGLIAAAMTTQADGRTERGLSLMVLSQGITVAPPSSALFDERFVSLGAPPTRNSNSVDRPGWCRAGSSCGRFRGFRLRNRESCPPRSLEPRTTLRRGVIQHASRDMY